MSTGAQHPAIEFPGYTPRNFQTAKHQRSYHDLSLALLLVRGNSSSFNPEIGPLYASGGLGLRSLVTLARGETSQRESLMETAAPLPGRHGPCPDPSADPARPSPGRLSTRTPSRSHQTGLRIDRKEVCRITDWRGLSLAANVERSVRQRCQAGGLPPDDAVGGGSRLGKRQPVSIVGRCQLEPCLDHEHKGQLAELIAL